MKVFVYIIMMSHLDQNPRPVETSDGATSFFLACARRHAKRLKRLETTTRSFYSCIARATDSLFCKHSNAVNYLSGMGIAGGMDMRHDKDMHSNSRGTACLPRQPSSESAARMKDASFWVSKHISACGRSLWNQLSTWRHVIV